MKTPFLLSLSFLTIGFFSGCGKTSYDFPEPEHGSSENAIAIRTGTFETKSFEYAADFGTITVPENRNNQRSNLIHLPVIRIHARSSVPREPIFYLAGGPGRSNMNCTPFDTLIAEHDFVMVGYRGVDGSVKLDCPEVIDALTQNDDLLSEESLRTIAAAWDASARRFAEQGIDWNGYTIPQTIEDMEAVRRTFHYQRINLQSESYGTRVAYLYGLMYPEHIHRSIMIAVNPPGHCMWDPQTIDEQLKRYGQLWSKDSVLSADSPDLVETMRNVLRTLPKKWLFFSINPGKVKVSAFCLLFHRETAALVFDAFVQAEKGDYSGLALLSTAFDYMVPSMFTWGELASKAVTADLDTAKVRSFCEDSSTIMGSPLHTVLWGPLLYTHIPFQLIPKELRTLQPSDVETLMLSGSLDFSDPPQYAAQELLPHLRNGKQIILSEYGHVGNLMYLRQKTSERILAEYYAAGIADTSRKEYVPMDFHVQWSFSSIAKTVLITGVVVVAGVITGLAYGVRKMFQP